jgi:hypothetical protein
LNEKFNNEVISPGLKHLQNQSSLKLKLRIFQFSSGIFVYCYFIVNSFGIMGLVGLLISSDFDFNQTYKKNPVGLKSSMVVRSFMGR